MSEFGENIALTAEISKLLSYISEISLNGGGYDSIYFPTTYVPIQGTQEHDRISDGENQPFTPSNGRLGMYPATAASSWSATPAPQGGD